MTQKRGKEKEATGEARLSSIKEGAAPMDPPLLGRRREH
jgi:hypothetical protein